MSARPLAVLALVAAAGLATGQLPGRKIIPGHRTVVLEKEFPGYAFYAVREKETRPVPEQPPLYEYRAAPIKFAPGVPQVVPTDVDLFVVPEADAKANPDPLVLGQKLADSLIAGAHRVAPVGAQEVDANDPRVRNEVRIVLQRADPVAGLIYDRTSNDPDDPRNFTDQQGNPLPGKVAGGGDEEPRGRGSWVIVVAVAVAVVGLGVLAWVRLARRNREDED